MTAATGNITRVCLDMGFKDVSYFARVFAAAPMTAGGSKIPAHTEQKNPEAAKKCARKRATRR